MPFITRASIEYAVPQLERAIAELEAVGTKSANGAAMNLVPVLVCMKAIGGWYDKVPHRRKKSSRPMWLDTL